MVRSAIDKNRVSVRTRLMEGMTPVRGDRVQLQQVVLNLILNAVEAMSSVEEGRARASISTGQAETGDILVAVRDSGPGIDPEHLDRIFAPFYTTKASGIGMGLSICRSIIDGHGGRLWAEANRPRGAVFSSLCRQARKIHEFSSERLAGLESRTKAPLEMVVVHGLAEVTNDSILQGAAPSSLIRVCGDENRRDRVPRIDEVSVELDARSFQASGRQRPSTRFRRGEAIPGNRLPRGTLRRCSPAPS